MEKISLTCLIMNVRLMGLDSCKKQQEFEMEEIQEYMSEEETLGQAMEKTSRDTRRLARAMESKNWMECETLSFLLH